MKPRSSSDKEPSDVAAAPAIQTVQRAALILDSFTASQPRLSMNQISSRLGLSRATAHRYINSLLAANLLRYDERTALYSLGPQVLTLAASARAGLSIITVAEPYMAQLHKAIDETVVLSVWDGETPTVVRSADKNDHILRTGIRTGARLDLSNSAQGRVFSAYLAADEVPGLPQLLRQSPELDTALQAIREHGLSVNSPANNGLRSIAAPIFEGKRIVAAMAIVGTVVSVPTDVGSAMAQALLETTRGLSQRLGDSADTALGASA